MTKYAYFLCVSLLLVLVSACTRGAPDILDSENLFDIPLGKLENSIDLFQINGVKSNRKNRLFAQNGLFWISNGNASKVLQFSSYGDLLGLIYNPQENPRPVLTASSSDKLANKRSFAFALEDVGEIVVQRSGTILLEDRTPESQKTLDPNLNAVLNRIVLRFDQNGKYLDYLGQEGKGGAAFPYIVSLHVTASDEIVVVSRTIDQWLVFWFDKDGNRRYAYQFSQNRLPVPANDGRFPALLSIFPDAESDLLYLHLAYYPIQEGGQTSGQDISLIESRIYTLDTLSGKFVSWFSLPAEYQNSKAAEVLGKTEDQFQALQSFIGVAVGGRLYFINHRSKNTHLLSVYDRNGRVISLGYISLDDNKLFELQWSVSLDGLISAFQGFADKASVSTWNTNRLSGLMRVNR